jgi:heme exporter protein CcmD
MTSLQTFFHMGGYAVYVWTAYASVFLFLLTLWFIPWRGWKKYVDQQQKVTHE